MVRVVLSASRKVGCPNEYIVNFLVIGVNQQPQLFRLHVGRMFPGLIYMYVYIYI